MKYLTSLTLLCFFYLANSQTNDWDINTSGKITYTNGNVGIGTSTVDSRLHVYRDATMGNWGSVATANSTIKVQESGTSMFLDGNSIYSTANTNLGTITNHYMSLGTNNIERIRISSNGNVGIGTTNPVTDLQIGDKGQTQQLSLQGPNSTVASSEILFIDGNGPAPHYYGMGIRYNSSSNYLSIDDNYNTGGLVNNSLFVVNRDGGNVGIGTTSPGAKLDIVGGTLWVSQSYNQRLEISQNLNNDGTAILNNRAAAGDFEFQLSGDSKFIIKRSGSVGIGTTTPSEKLEVNGTICSKEVKVRATGWPDYVFEPDYDLTSLKELEQFIQTEKHLPEIPSAEEIEAEGLVLGEMNRLLLKKIEELTLHLIESKKERQKLIAKANNQEERIEELMGYMIELKEENEIQKEFNRKTGGNH